MVRNNMSRYDRHRRQIKYITAEQQLKAELHQLWKVGPKVTQSVAEAAALGIGRKMQNTSMEKNASGKSTAESAIQQATRNFSVSISPDDLNKVYFGAWVT